MRCSNAIHLTMIAAGNGDAPKPTAYFYLLNQNDYYLISIGVNLILDHNFPSLLVPFSS
jgi:hypothetical protein